MKSWQGLTLNIVSVIATGMLLGQLWLNKENQGMNIKVMQGQTRFNAARQADTVFRQMVVRMAVLADKDTTLRNLMNKYNLQATVTIDGVKKTVP